MWREELVDEVGSLSGGGLARTDTPCWHESGLTVRSRSVSTLPTSADPAFVSAYCPRAAADSCLRPQLPMSSWIGDQWPTSPPTKPMTSENTPKHLFAEGKGFEPLRTGWVPP